jgi:hypothetical protein
LEETTYISLGYRGVDNSKIYLEEAFIRLKKESNAGLVNSVGTEHSIP